MTFTDDEIKQYATAKVGTVLYTYTPYGWKNIGVVDNVPFDRDSNGRLVPVTPDGYDPVADAVTPVVNLAEVDENGDPITWRHLTSTKVMQPSTNRSRKDYATIFTDGYQKTIVPRKRNETETKSDPGHDVGQRFIVRFETTNQPHFAFDSHSENFSIRRDSDGVIIDPVDHYFDLSVAADGASVIRASSILALKLFTLGVPLVSYRKTTPDGFQRAPSPTGMDFSADGKTLFLLSAGKLTGYNLTTPFDLMSAQTTQPSSFDVSPNISPTSAGVVVNSNGRLVYILDTTMKKVYEFDLDVANDVSTMIFRSNFYNNPEDIGEKTILTTDGKFMYSLCCYKYTENSQIKRYPLTEPYSVSTATNHADIDTDFPNARDYRIFSGYPSWTERNIQGAQAQYSGGWRTIYDHYGKLRDFHLKEDGTEIFTISECASVNGEIKRYELNTAYDQSSSSNVTTIVHTIGSTAPEDFERNQKENGVQAMHISPDGTKMFILDTSSRSIVQYNMQTAFDIGSINTGNLLKNVPKTLDAFGYDEILQLSDIPAVASSPPGNLTPNHPDDTGFSQSTYQDFSLIRDMQFNAAGTKLYVSNDHKIYEYNLTTAYSISSALFSRSHSQYQTHLENKNGTANFHYDSGGRIYISDASDDIIREFGLDSHIGTGTSQFVEKVLDVDISNPKDIDMSSADSSIFISGTGSVSKFPSAGTAFRIEKYNMSTPGKLHSAALADSYYNDNLVATGDGIVFNQDMTKAFIAGNDGRAQRIKTLEVDSALSNAIVSPDEYDLRSTNNNDDIKGIRWNSTGTEFTVTGADLEETYKTSTPYRITLI